MKLFNSEHYYNALELSKYHSGIKIDVKDTCFWGEYAYEPWDVLKLLKRATFYDFPPMDIPAIIRIVQMIIKLDAMFVQIRPSTALTQIEENILYNSGFIRENHLSAKILIEDPEVMWKNMERDKQKGVRKAREKYGLEIIESHDKSDILLFYKQLTHLYKRIRHPIKHLSYFEALFQSFPQGSIKLLLCKDGCDIVAGQIATYWDDEITALYTATAEGKKDMHAGDLLIWYMLENGSKQGYRVFDFGGGGNPDKDYSPRAYKMRFGTKFENVGRYMYSDKFYYKTIKKLYEMRLKA